MKATLLQSLFNILNETIVCFGSGIFGLAVIISHGTITDKIQYTGCMMLATTGLLSLFNFRNKTAVSRRNVVIVTGCDSGLGFNLALKCNELNATVVAACLDLQSSGAQKLIALESDSKIRVFQLDIRSRESIAQFYYHVLRMLKENEELSLSVLVNNAGVMCFGEFEWQTEQMLDTQINVNLLGTMKLTHILLPLLRTAKGRVITVTSHCALQPLPGLAVYAASKAALLSWTDALRQEVNKYGVEVVNFIPGSFVMSSNITARQQAHANAMRSTFTDEQHSFYDDYFDRYNNYLKMISGPKEAIVFDDTKLMDTFEHALLDEKPKCVYKHEPWRYTFYHTLFRVTPAFVRDWLVEKFISLPQYRQPKVTFGEQRRVELRFKPISSDQ